MRTRSTYTAEDFRRRTGLEHGQTTEPAPHEKEPRTNTVRFVCSKVIRVDASGGGHVCAQWAKLSPAGPRCVDHWPKLVS